MIVKKKKKASDSGDISEWIQKSCFVLNEIADFGTERLLGHSPEIGGELEQALSRVVLEAARVEHDERLAVSRRAGFAQRLPRSIARLRDAAIQILGDLDGRTHHVGSGVFRQVDLWRLAATVATGSLAAYERAHAQGQWIAGKFLLSGSRVLPTPGDRRALWTQVYLELSHPAWIGRPGVEELCRVAEIIARPLPEMSFADSLVCCEMARQAQPAVPLSAEHPIRAIPLAATKRYRLRPADIPSDAIPADFLPYFS